MAPAELVQKLLDRLSEARVCLEQGLGEGTASIIEEILAEIDDQNLPESAREEIRSRAEAMLKSMEGPCTTGDSPPEEPGRTDASQFYNYGLALMDGQFWEEAIKELNTAAELGFQPLQCWEYCGDCAFHLGNWKDAFRFYECVYSDESLTDELKSSILTKMTKCSQARKKRDVVESKPATDAPAASAPAVPVQPDRVDPTIQSLGSYAIEPVIGSTVSSADAAYDGRSHEYAVTGLLHVGSSSLIVELEDRESGRKYAGQSLNGKQAEGFPYGRLLPWAKRQMVLNSRHLVRVYDLAETEGHFFIVREHLPLSLCDILKGNGNMPIRLAVRLAYQVLEALGDLHLHMTAEGVSHMYHLDLRPSRVLLRKDKPFAKVYNGGLWRELEKGSPASADLREVPLAFLAYRAPEQFRTYLARKKPPVFTDIYLFGVLFYEMLTGTQAFKASSFGEYEIQHCEQYPSPPKVWRPDIPESLNEIIMNCLASNPVRRFRSTTQISLILEKAFPSEISRPKDEAYLDYLEELELV